MGQDDLHTSSAPIPPSGISLDGAWTLPDYQAARLFHSFLPGIAGETGVPVWVFYSNRAQAVASFGLGTKDGAMLEFHPANKAAELLHTHGFRTFLKDADGFYEPFAMEARGGAAQTMVVRAHEIELVEESSWRPLRFELVYHTLPGASVGALLRTLKITNTGPAPVSFDLLDGLPFVVPAFVKNGSIKDVANTKCGTVEVLGLDASLLYCRSRVKSSDAVVLEMVEAGNFYFGFADRSPHTPRLETLRVVADPRLVFGDGAGFVKPWAFLAGRGDVAAPQRALNYMPCAFLHAAVQLPPGASFVLLAAAGQAESIDAAAQLRRQAAMRGFWEQARAENARTIESIRVLARTVSAHRVFDQYCGHTFLDNCLRGGLPATIGGQTVHLFFRKHGDMERDYNNFLLQPSFFSQGNANFRDILQNRRCDLFFNPAVGADNLRAFAEALQADGNNPLSYLGCAFRLATPLPAALAATLAAAGLTEAFTGALAGRAVTPGDLACWAAAHETKLGIPLREFVARALTGATREEMFRATHDGYWCDHWTYLPDLLEQFAAIYPERVAGTLFADEELAWFDNPQVVLPRDRRVTLDPASGQPRQAASLEVCAEKTRRLAARPSPAHLARDAAGRIHRVHLAEKFLCLLATRLGSLDADGIGVEMLGNRPGWNDALNGLPGLFGSSVCETAECLRLARLLQHHLRAARPAAVRLSAELAALIQRLGLELARHAGEPSAFAAAAQIAAEEYRGQVRLEFSGKRTTLSPADLGAFLEAAGAFLADAVERARDAATGLYHTYFYYEPAGFDSITDGDGKPQLSQGRPCARVRGFRRKELPAFLEGQVRVLRILPPAEREALCRAVQQSALFDRKLGLFKLNAPLAGAPQAIGRAGRSTRCNSIRSGCCRWGAPTSRRAPPIACAARSVRPNATTSGMAVCLLASTKAGPCSPSSFPPYGWETPPALCMSCRRCSPAGWLIRTTSRFTNPAASGSRITPPAWGFTCKRFWKPRARTFSTLKHSTPCHAALHRRFHHGRRTQTHRRNQAVGALLRSRLRLRLPGVCVFARRLS
jgi:hypothetical protein